MNREAIANQGEIRIDKVDALPEGLDPREADHANGHIISHSEQGHHHVLSGGVQVLERTKDVPAGMQIFYAIVEDAARLYQDAATPHDAVNLDPGIYEMRIKREYDPFGEQARRVAD